MIHIQQLYLIQQVIDYIEEHIKEEILPENLARLVGYSPYHFYRIFNRYTGYTLMDYVVRRKLQYAMYELLLGKKIVDVAMDYGFETHSGFTKAFKRLFGSSPSLYRLHTPHILPMKLDLMSLHQKKVGGIILQPKIMDREGFYVAGKTFEVDLENITYTRDAPAIWDLSGLGGSVEGLLYEHLSPKKHGEYCINLSNDEQKERFTYLFAVDYDDNNSVSSEFSILYIPSTRYAIFKTPPVEVGQFVSAIKGTWRYILEDWLPYSPYEVDENGYDFEYYDEHCHYWDYAKIYMEIHIPIKEKSRE